MFNHLHATHMGGVWERMIWVTRRILNSKMKEHSAQGLTHEVLTTFIAEASAIINSRPLTSIPSENNTSPRCFGTDGKNTSIPCKFERSGTNGTSVLVMLCC